jgi:hypothetical protein
VGARPGWFEGLLLKDLVLVSTWPFDAKRASWEKGMTKSCGKSAPPLQRVKTKYLAVSPVTDNFERHDFEAVQGSPHANFLKIKTYGLNWEYGNWCKCLLASSSRAMSMCQCLQE